jgi:probable phosphomutase (TIGR03848 family)
MDQSSWDDTLLGVRPSPGPGRGAVSHQSSRDKRRKRSLPGSTVRSEGRAISTVILLRHGRTTANTGGVLAGWTPGVQLDENGEKQVQAVAERLSTVPLAAIVSSPLERCLQTASAVAAGRDLTVRADDRLGEARYGDWTGRTIKELAKQPLWKVVQQHPSAAVFPGPEGEGLAQTQARAVAAVRAWNAELGADAVWLACSHGDVIKAILADALGLHLDQFQRIVVDPASISVISYSETRPFVVRMNDTGGDVAALIPPPKRRRRRTASSDAVVGGGAGPGV